MRDLARASLKQLAARRALAFALAALGLSACVPRSNEPLVLSAGPLPMLVFDEGRGFFGTPFPSDARRHPSGAPDLRGLPNPNGVGFVDASVEASAERDGFDPSGALYFRFDRALPLSSRASVDARARLPGITLVDVDERSPERGRTFPLWARATAHHDGVRPPHLLQLLPVPGVGLREGTTYALVVRRDLDGDGDAELAGSREVQGLLEEIPEGDSRWVEAFAPLRRALPELGLRPKEIAAATVFTTGVPTNELFRWVGAALDEPAPQLIGELVRERDHEGYVVLRGNVRLPLYQEGTPPHFFGGGRLALDDEGLPVAQTHVDAPFYLTIPKGEVPSGGVPLYFYVHGTGGLATQAIDRGYRESPRDISPPGSGLASWVAPVGYGTSCLAGTYSPDRIGWRALDGYAAYMFFNPVAMRDNFRQMLLEQVHFLRLLDELVIDPALVPEAKLPEGEVGIRFARERAVVGGQSLGSYLSGMVAALTRRFDGAILTGAGGSWIEFGFGPKDPVDLTALLEKIAMSRGERLDHHHPFITAFQTAVGPADNTHYTPYLLRRPSEAAKVPHVLVIEGQRDLQVPVNLQRALVLSIGVDLVGREVGASLEEQLFPALRYGGLRHLPEGIAGNRTAPDGSSRTAVVVRHEEDGRLEGHYVIFQQPRAREQLTSFLADIAEGRTPFVQ